MGSTGVVALLVLAPVTVAVIAVSVLTRRAGSSEELRLWASGHAVALTEGNRAMATYWVRLLITLRVVGGAAGWLVASLVEPATGSHVAVGGTWACVVLGWVAGTAWAEASLPRPVAVPGTASLTPRRPSDYLPRHLRVAPGATAALVVSLALAAVVDPAVGGTGPVLVAAAAVVLALAATLEVRHVVGRRQPTASPDVVAVDDAIRATTVHHVAGGTAAALLLVALELTLTLFDTRTLPYGLRGWIPLALLVAALLAWRWSAHRAWVVRRPRPPARASAS